MVRKCCKESIIKRYNKYLEYNPVVFISDDGFENYPIKSKNGYYTLDIFLLNRLFQSLRGVVFTDSDDCSMYDEKSRTIFLSKDAIEKRALCFLDNCSDDEKNFL